MPDDKADKTKPTPWYLTWRGALAAVGALVLLSAVIPSKEPTLTKQADKISERMFDICLKEQKKDKKNYSKKRAQNLCECVETAAKRQVLDGKTEIGEFWYATTVYACSLAELDAEARDRHSELGKHQATINEQNAKTQELPVRSKTSVEGADKRLARLGEDKNQKQEGRGGEKTASQRDKKSTTFRGGNPKDLFGRIQRGDYLWAKSFPEKDKALFGYGIALKETFDEICPGAIGANRAGQIEHFLNALHGFEVIDIMQGRKPLDFAGLMQSALVDVPFIDGSRKQLGRLVKAEGCDGKRVQALADNLSLMLTGGRPIHGTKIPRSTLVEEKVSLVEQKHAYKNRTGAALTSRGAGLLDKDYREARAGGMTVLECHYDENPKDEYYEVQYYWGIDPLTTIGFQIVNFGEAFLRAAQQRLTKANGRAYTHPFTTYGSPRLACPARKDPDIDHKQIYAPRKAVSKSAGKLPVPKNPTVTEKRAFTKYEYGPSPEDFVPPIPKNLPNNTLYLTMEKQGAGSLQTVELARFGPWSLTREYEIGSAKQQLLDEDLSAVSKQKPRVLVCKYLAERRGVVKVSRHWFKKNPKGVDVDYLRGRLQDHPILVIGDARKNCAPSFVALER